MKRALVVALALTLAVATGLLADVVLHPGTLNGTVVQPYGMNNSMSWNTTGNAPGAYHLEVDVRNQGSTLGYEAWSAAAYTLTA